MEIAMVAATDLDEESAGWAEPPRIRDSSALAEALKTLKRKEVRFVSKDAPASPRPPYRQLLQEALSPNKNIRERAIRILKDAENGYGIKRWVYEGRVIIGD